MEARACYVILRDTSWSDGITREVIEVHLDETEAKGRIERYNRIRPGQVVYSLDTVPLVG